MGGDDGKPAARQMPAQEPQQLFERGLIESERRLIEKPEEARHQSEPRKRQAAFLPGGEERCRIFREIGEIEGGKSAAEVAASQEAAPEFEVFGDRQGRFDSLLMSRIMRLLPDGEIGAPALEDDLALNRVAQPGDQPQERGFARAIRAPELQELT